MLIYKVWCMTVNIPHSIPLLPPIHVYHHIQSAGIFRNTHEDVNHSLTCSSSSVRFSPSSLATLFKLLKEILPYKGTMTYKYNNQQLTGTPAIIARLTVSSSSKSLKAFKISSLESFSLCKIQQKTRYVIPVQSRGQPARVSNSPS